MTDNKDYDAWENAEIKPVENRYTKLAAEAPQGDWENAKPTEGVGFFKDTLRDAVIYLANKKSDDYYAMQWGLDGYSGTEED